MGGSCSCSGGVGGEGEEEGGGKRGEGERRWGSGGDGGEATEADVVFAVVVPKRKESCTLSRANLGMHAKMRVRIVGVGEEG